MNPRVSVAACIVAGWLLAAGALAQTPVGTAFTYQGMLKQAGVPATGAYDIVFTLYDAEYGGNVVDTPIQAEDLPVNEGLFTIGLNFGSAAFGGDARWLEIAVRPGASTGSFTTLDPRQPLTVVPYALYALQSGAAGNADLLDGLDSTAFLQAVPNPLTLAGDQPGGHIIKGSNSSTIDDSYGVVGESAGGWGAAGVYGLLSSSGGFRSGVLGRAGPGTGTYPVLPVGVWGDSDWGHGVLGYSAHDIGVFGRSFGESGFTFGVRGDVVSPDGCGVAGFGDPGVGVYGYSTSNDGVVAASWAAGHSGVYARNEAASGTTYGVYAKSVSDAGTGVLGEVIATSGTTYGVFGRSLSPDGYGGYFEGRGYFSGNVGIGTATPGEKLVVEGNAVVTGKVTIGSGHTNSGWGAFVAGYANSATAEVSTISGGASNYASGYSSAIAGGYSNNASGVSSAIAGGGANNASGLSSAIGGGYSNNATGTRSTVPGGFENQAGGEGSFAAGTRAHVRTPAEVGGGDTDGDEGTFVWSDSSPGTFASTGPNQFLIYASGGVAIGASNPSGFQLTVAGDAAKPGGGSWSTLSDARAKANVAPLAGALDRLLKLRGVSFEYTADARFALPGRQIGLIAQEVEQVFPDWVSADPDGYKYVTERGTTALLVEALRELRQEKDAEIAAQNDQIATLREQNDCLEQRLAALEVAVARLAQSEKGER